MQENDRRTKAEEALRKGIASLEEDRTGEAQKHLTAAAEYGSMKAGRYLALIALQQAAQRGDITSKVILGTLYEFGYALPHDTEKAKELYESALRDDHRNREGFMLAAGADLGMGRICAAEGDGGRAREHLRKARDGGEPYLSRVSEIWMQSV